MSNQQREPRILEDQTATQAIEDNMTAEEQLATFSTHEFMEEFGSDTVQVFAMIAHHLKPIIDICTATTLDERGTLRPASYEARAFLRSLVRNASYNSSADSYAAKDFRQFMAERAEKFPTDKRREEAERSGDATWLYLNSRIEQSRASILAQKNLCKTLDQAFIDAFGHSALQKNVLQGKSTYQKMDESVKQELRDAGIEVTNSSPIVVDDDKLQQLKQELKDAHTALGHAKERQADAEHMGKAAQVRAEQQTINFLTQNIAQLQKSVAKRRKKLAKRAAK